MKLKQYFNLNNPQHVRVMQSLMNITGLSVDELGEIKIRMPSVMTSILTKISKPAKNAEAMTLGKNSIFILKKEIVDNPFLFFNLICHELIHIAQMRKLGRKKFAAQYIREYKKNLKTLASPQEAYKNISFEKEAVAAQRRFMEEYKTLLLNAPK